MHNESTGNVKPYYVKKLSASLFLAQHAIIKCSRLKGSVDGILFFFFFFFFFTKNKVGDFMQSVFNRVACLVKQFSSNI